MLTKHLIAKIGDLGVAKMIDPDHSRSHSVVPGNKDFSPPEVVSDGDKSHYGKPIDIFSLGCIMIHVVTHKWPTPLPETRYDENLKKKVALSEVDRRNVYLDQIQELKDLVELIVKCLQDDHKLRPVISKMVDELEKLKISYKKDSVYADNRMINAVEFEKYLKLQDDRISELQVNYYKNNNIMTHMYGHHWYIVIIAI